MMNSTSYRYLKMGPFYVCLEENPLKLAWLLYAKTKPFNSDLEAESEIKLLQFVPSRILKPYRIFRLVILCSLRKRGLLTRQFRTIIKLPENGHIAFALQAGGYKVCHLSKEVVVTKFPADLDLAVVSDQVGKRVEVGNYGFAPKVWQWSVEERRLEEEYVNGSWSLPVYPDWRALYHDFMPLLEAMLTATPPRVVKLRTYIEKVQELASRLEGAFPTSESSKASLCAIRNFAVRTSQRVLNAQVQEISLAISHGDLWRGNLLIAADRFVAVDWQTLEFRGPLHDLHSVLFRTLRGALPADKKPTMAEMALEMKRAIGHLKARLEKRNPELRAKLFPSTLTDDMHRWVFYLELLHIALKDFQGAKDHHEVRLSTILEFVHMFDQFEGIVGVRNNESGTVASPKKANYVQEG